MKTSCLILTSVLFFGIRAFPASAEPVSGPDGDAVGTPEGVVIPAPSPVDKPHTQDAKDARAGRLEPPRHFFNLFYGSVSTADDDVSASSQDCLVVICGSPSSSVQHAHFRASAVFGARIGKWLADYPAIGFAAGFSYLRADAPGVNIWYLPISFVTLARYALLRSHSTPDGRMQLYGGLMIGGVLGDIKVHGEGGFTSNFGHGTLFGIAWHFPSFALFGECRIMNARLSHETSDDWDMFGTSSASADLDSRQVVYGVSFKY